MPKAIVWLLVFLTSGVLNTSAMKLILKKGKFTLHSISLLNFIVADLFVGGVLYVSLAINALRIEVCVTRAFSYFSLCIFTDVSLLSVAMIALNQANKAKSITRTNACNNLNENKRNITMKLAFIWVYSIAFPLVISALFPTSKIWFVQVIFLVIFVFIVHCYTFIQLQKNARTQPENRSLAVENRIKVTRRAQRLIIGFVITEVIIWMPSIFANSLTILKNKPLHEVANILYWCTSSVFLSPLINPVLFFWTSKFKMARQNNSI